jgi:Fe-S-cluster containining protein
MDYARNRSYFFDRGIRFECQRCGACCTGDPGYIFVDKQEVLQIAEYISRDAKSFVKEFLYPFGTGFSIKECHDGRCLFYREECTIYPVRPEQCRIFPFWFENLRSLKKWRRVTRECPGIDQGPLYSKERILEYIHRSIEHSIKSYLRSPEE